MHSDSDMSVKKRKKKTQIVYSSSSSDEESEVPARKRKNWTRLVSSSSSDSDGSCIHPAASSHKKLRVLSDSCSSMSSSESEIEEAFQYQLSKNKKSNTKTYDIASASGSSDGNSKQNPNKRGDSGSQSSDSDESEKCIICFKAFRGVIAHPSGCSHNFHSECLLQWSKTSNTCPIDRVKYTKIIVTDSDGKVIKRHDITTPPPLNDYNDIEPDDPTFCEVCSQHDREHEMLLCDRCEAGYHLNCLIPPLFEVPDGDWFCPDCSDENAEIENELDDLRRDDGSILDNRLRPRRTARWIGPRTMAARRIFNRMRRVAEESLRQQPSSSTSRSTSRRRKSKKTRCRRTTEYKFELVTVDCGRKVEVKVAINTRRRQKKKKRRCNASSSRGRMGSSKRSSATTGIETDAQQSRADEYLHQPLDIHGSRPQLEYFSGWEAEDELEDEGGGSLSVLRARNVGVRGMANRKQMAAQILRSAPRRPIPRIAESSAPPDLLSSILDEQTKWHSPNAVFHSNSNGDVKVELPTKSSNLPVKKTVGNGESGTTSGGAQSSSSSSHKESGGSQRNGDASTSVPPLQPPPQPVFSRVYEDEDFDLYADIEPPLAPPPEPPALLLALDGDDGSSSPEDTMLVIDDRQTYDPDVPTSPPPSPEKPDGSQEENKSNQNLTEKMLDDPPVDLSAIRLPSPEPRIDACPNRVMYSAESTNIARQSKCDSDSDKDIEVEESVSLVSTLSISTGLNIGTKLSSNVNREDDTEDNGKEENRENILPPEETEINALKNINETEEVTNEKSADEIGNSSEKCDPESLDEEQLSKLEELKEKESCDTEEPSSNDTKEEVEKYLPEEELDKNENVNVDLKLEVKSSPLDGSLKEEEIETKDDLKLEEGEIKFEDEEDTEIVTKEAKDVIEKIDKFVKDVPDRPSSPGELIPVEKEETDGMSKPKCPETGENILNSSESEDKHKEIEWSPDSTPPRKSSSEKEVDQEGEDVLELGCGDDERDGLVDITDEEISTYEKSWELEDNQTSTEKTAGLEGLETEAISDCEYNIAEDGQAGPRVPVENGPKEEGEIISDDKKVPVAWKKITKAKERSYREKDTTTKEKTKKKEKKPKEKRKELERYDVRKIISDKPKKRKVDEFGRDISPSRSRSLSDSRSRSNRSKSLSVRRSRSRSRSRSRKRRSRDRKSQNRSRGRRSRGRSRNRSKRRGGKSRSRSTSRRRRSRSSRPKERRTRDKSRDKKRRKRDSSISCSSCSCSSCERERRKTSKKLTVTVRNKKTINSGKEKKKNKYKDRGDLKRRRVDSPVPSKEVFTSGDNILVSVNFKSSKSGEAGRKEPSKKRKEDESKKKKDKSSKENQPLRSIVSKSSNQQALLRRTRLNARNLKPVAIIDLAQSPFREQTLSPKEIIILTDSDSDDKRKNDDNSLPCQMTGPKTPPEPHIKFNIVSSKPQMLRSLVNPLLDTVDQLEGEGEEEEDDERVELPHKGPNTPPEPPVPYDPFEPTKSRSPTPLQEMEESRNPPTPPGDKILPPEPPQRPASPPKPPPETPKTPSPLHSPPKPPEDNPSEKAPLSPPNNCNDDSMDMGGGDSPYSPGSSDAEDIFEPPLPQITTPATMSKIKTRAGVKHLQKLTPSPLKRKPGPTKSSTPLKNSKGSKKELGLKLDEDQLKILDDVPNSAVEMQVKDKFLKKLNRQERVVEEVKMVLKPHYTKKHVTKEEYKEILRKSVPKICHSRSGEINPMKIQRLIEAYVKKYRHLRKKRKMNTFSAPDSLLKPKPKATMWC